MIIQRIEFVHKEGSWRQVTSWQIPITFGAGETRGRFRNISLPAVIANGVAEGAATDLETALPSPPAAVRQPLERESAAAALLNLMIISDEDGNWLHRGFDSQWKRPRRDS